MLRLLVLAAHLIYSTSAFGFPGHPAPPPAAPESSAHTVSWSALSPVSSSSGCAYNNWRVYHHDAGQMTWKQCMLYASTHGAFINAGSYTCGWGWSSVLVSDSLAYRPGSYSSFATSGVNTFDKCCLAREYNNPNGAISSLPSPQYATYAGLKWEYQDFGSNYMHQCTAIANTYGGHVITPGTVGKTSSGYYHTPAVHHCNTHQRIHGSNFVYTTDSAGQTGPAAMCMVGIAMSEV